MKIKIHDSTLRDGNHAAKHRLSLGIVENHCNLADRAGIYSVEVGHGNGLGASSFQVGLSPFKDLDIIKIAVKRTTSWMKRCHEWCSSQGVLQAISSSHGNR